MRLRRPGWAGVEIECDDETLLIDDVLGIAPMAPPLLGADEPFPPASRPRGAAIALVTHLLANHADADVLAAEAVVPIHYGSLNKARLYVETPHPVERLRDKAKEFGIRAETLEPGERFELG